MENGKKNNILTLEELVGGMTDVCSWADLLEINQEIVYFG